MRYRSEKHVSRIPFLSFFSLPSILLRHYSTKGQHILREPSVSFVGEETEGNVYLSINRGTFEPEDLCKRRRYTTPTPERTAD